LTAFLAGVGEGMGDTFCPSKKEGGGCSTRDMEEKNCGASEINGDEDEDEDGDVIRGLRRDPEDCVGWRRFEPKRSIGSALAAGALSKSRRGEGEGEGEGAGREIISLEVFCCKLPFPLLLTLSASCLRKHSA